MMPSLAMVSSMFWSTLNASIHASVLVAVVLVIQRFLAKHLSARICYAFWLVVLLRLLLPELPQSPLSMIGLTQEASRVVSVASSLVTRPLLTEPLVTELTEGFERPESSMVPMTSAASRPSSSIDKEPTLFPESPLSSDVTSTNDRSTIDRCMTTALPCMWLFGCLFFLARECYAHYRTMRFVSKLSPISDREVIQLLKACRSEMHVERSVQLLASDNEIPPALFGIFRPKIILPQRLLGQLNAAELRFLFLHELAHLRRQDILMASIASWLQSIHWFNPLIGYAVRRMSEDREIACDEMVLRKIRLNQRADYGKTILKVLEELRTEQLSVRFVGMAYGKDSLKRRLAMLVTLRAPGWRQSILGISLLVILGITGLTQPLTVLAQSPSLPDLPQDAKFRLGDHGFRHHGDAWFLEFSDDGNWLACASHYGPVYLFDAASGALVQRIELDARPKDQRLAFPQRVHGLEFLPTSTAVMVAVGESLVTYSIPEGVREQTIPLGRHELRQLAMEGWSFRLSEDAQKIAVYGDFQGVCLVLDAASGEIVERLRHSPGGINEASFSPDGKRLAAATKNPGVVFWDVSTGDLEAEPDGHDYTHDGRIASHATNVRYAPDGSMVAMAAGNEVILWDLETKQIRRKLEGVRPSEWIADLEFTPDGKQLAAGIQENEGRVCVWDTDSGELLHELNGRSWILRQISISPDGKTLAASFAYNRLRLWNLETGEPLFDHFGGHEAPVDAVAYSADGKRIATGSGLQQIMIWDAQSGAHVRTLDAATSSSALEFLPDGHLVSGWKNKEGVAILDWQNGGKATQLKHFGIPINDHHLRAIRYVADTDALYVAGFDRKRGTVQVTSWDVSERKRYLKYFEGPITYATAITLSPDGSLAAIADESVIHLWRLTDGIGIAELAEEGRAVKSMVFSGDGQRLISGFHDGTIRVWRCDTFASELTLQAGQPIGAVALSGDGKILAAAGGAVEYPRLSPNRGEIALWDLASGILLRTLPGNQEDVTSLSFSPDDTQLTTGHQDGSLIVWDLAELRTASKDR